MGKIGKTRSLGASKIERSPGKRSRWGRNFDDATRGDGKQAKYARFNDVSKPLGAKSRNGAGANGGKRLKNVADVVAILSLVRRRLGGSRA